MFLVEVVRTDFVKLHFKENLIMMIIGPMTNMMCDVTIYLCD